MSYINAITVGADEYEISESAIVNSVPRIAIAALGSTIKFSVAASMFGTGASYQWQWLNSQNRWSNTSYTGNTTDTITTQATAAKSGLKFRCVVTAGDKQYISSISKIIVY